jgi:hypothetical protein
MVVQFDVGTIRGTGVAVVKEERAPRAMTMRELKASMMVWR